MDAIKALKTVVQQYEIAHLALEKIADPDYPMRMAEAKRTLEKLAKLDKKKAEQKE